MKSVSFFPGGLCKSNDQHITKLTSSVTLVTQKCRRDYEDVQFQVLISVYEAPPIHYKKTHPHDSDRGRTCEVFVPDASWTKKCLLWTNCYWCVKTLHIKEVQGAFKTATQKLCSTIDLCIQMPGVRKEALLQYKFNRTITKQNPTPFERCSVGL